MDGLNTSSDKELTSLFECFTKAKLSKNRIFNQPSQVNARKQLPNLLKLIFTNKEFLAKLTPDERIAFYNDYTKGIANLLLTGDCLSLFEEMQEWCEYLEELVDYDEFKSDILTRENITFDDIKDELI